MTATVADMDEAARRAVSSIASSSKYRTLCRSTIESMVELERERQGAGTGAKRLAAGARKRLHRVAALYLGEAEHHGALAALEEAAASGSDERVREGCLRILRAHASSRERIPEMAEMYRRVFEITGMPEVLVDLACAYNPLAWRWMGLAGSVRYLAYDINRRTVDLVNRYFALEGIQGRAELRDVVCSPVTERAHVALLLKMYHCLEHRQRGAAWRVVQRIPAAWVVVSFPARNLSRRTVDIAGNYSDEIRRGGDREGYEVREEHFEAERLVIIRKERSGP